MNNKTLIIGVIIVASYVAVNLYINTPCPTCSPANMPKCHYTNLSTCSQEIGTQRYFGIIENSSRELMNNVWGADDGENVTSYIYYKCNGNFGWKWNRSAVERLETVYPIYPEVIVGVQPWRKLNESTSQYFPIKLGEIKNWKNTVEYRYIGPTTGSFNLAYDIWITDDLPPARKKAEIMIWIYGHLDQSIPAGYVNDGIHGYEYYTKRANNDAGESWDYYAFILKDQDISSHYHEVDIKKLMEFLIMIGAFNGDVYVDDIELGNEIWKGQGHIEIEKYVISLNDDII